VPWSPDPDPDAIPGRRVGDGLDTLLTRLGAGSTAATTAIFSRWEEVVGASVAAHAQPLQLKGTTLVVGVDGGAYATQLRILTPQLLARVAEFAGPGAVDDVEVRVRP
jgi:predicted nucleic acid-binding Zn ribbon protein